MKRKVAIGILCLGLTFYWMATRGMAQAQPAASKAPTPTATATPATEPPAVNLNQGVTTSKDGLVSLDFRDADIKNVLKVLAFNSGVNIVAGPEVTGLVTIQLKDVPWQRALDVVLATYSYAYERKGNIITVTTIENLKKRREDAQILAEQEPLVTKTFTLNFSKASDVITSLEKMKTPRGSINYDQRTNTLIVRDVENNIDLVSDVIKTLDSVTPQVLIEAKIVETTLSNTEKLGVDWTAQLTASGAKRPTTFPFGTTRGSETLPSIFPAPEDTEFAFGTLDATNLQAVFELLDQRSDTNILSNPRIVTVDNQAARIAVGSQYPIPQYTYNQDQGKLQVSGWLYKDIGVVFEVTPHVNNANFVTLEIKPQITDILDYVTVESTSLPRLSNEEAITKVMIKAGQTLVIAGLIKDNVTETKHKVPFLGDIPLLGYAFRHNSMTKTKTDLLIFLTPHIITPQLDTAKSASAPSKE